MKKEVARHVMVPKHEVLSEKEAEQLLEKLNIIRAQLPIILSSDPAIKKLETKPGDIIKVTRKNSVTGTNYAYRIVSES